jgi:transposase-like protein
MPNGKPRDAQKERFWRQAIRRWLRSGLTARAFCLEHGLAEANLYAWRRTLAARDAQTVPFAEVQVLADEADSKTAQAANTALELVLANGRVLRIGASFEADTLRRLLPLLEEGRSC